MVWGLTGGLVAGMVGGAPATVLHLPTRLLVSWLDGVATAAAGWPWGTWARRTWPSWPRWPARLAGPLPPGGLGPRPVPPPAPGGRRRRYWQVALGGAGPLAALVVAAVAAPAAGDPAASPATPWGGRHPVAGGRRCRGRDGRPGRGHDPSGPAGPPGARPAPGRPAHGGDGPGPRWRPRCRSRWPHVVIVARVPARPHRHRDHCGRPRRHGGGRLRGPPGGRGRYPAGRRARSPCGCAASAGGPGAFSAPRTRDTRLVHARRGAGCQLCNREVVGLLAGHDGHQLGPAAQAELPVDALQVVVDRLGADEQACRRRPGWTRRGRRPSPPAARRGSAGVERRPRPAGSPRRRRPLAPGPGADPVEDRAGPGDVGRAAVAVTGSHPALAPGQQGAGLLERCVHRGEPGQGPVEAGLGVSADVRPTARPAVPARGVTRRRARGPATSSPTAGPAPSWAAARSAVAWAQGRREAVASSCSLVSRSAASVRRPQPWYASMASPCHHRNPGSLMWPARAATSSKWPAASANRPAPSSRRPTPLWAQAVRWSMPSGTDAAHVSSA